MQCRSLALIGLLFALPACETWSGRSAPRWNFKLSEPSGKSDWVRDVPTSVHVSFEDKTLFFESIVGEKPDATTKSEPTFQHLAKTVHGELRARGYEPTDARTANFHVRVYVKRMDENHTTKNPDLVGPFLDYLANNDIPSRIDVSSPEARKTVFGTLADVWALHGSAEQEGIRFDFEADISARGPARLSTTESDNEAQQATKRENFIPCRLAGTAIGKRLTKKQAALLLVRRIAAAVPQLLPPAIGEALQPKGRS